MDRVWKLSSKQIAEKDFILAAKGVVDGYDGVKLECVREAQDCLSFFFKVPLSDSEPVQIVELELSIYDLGSGQIVLSLEPDAAENNHYWDEASQLAEDLAEDLGGENVTL
jgi:hypothetical protein